MRFVSRARWALAAALLVAVAGCSGNKGKIEGTKWVSQTATVKGQELPPGARQIHFDKDGHLLFIANAKPYKGSYALGMGPAVTFTLEEDWQGRKIHPEKVIVEGDRLVLTDADGSEIPFQRIN